MQVGIARSISSVLVVAVCSIFVLIWASPGRSDPAGDPGPTASAEPDDPLVEPFVLLLPSDWQQVTDDPEAYARWALTPQAGESRLEPFTTPSGIHLLRPPDAPLAQPDAGLSGLLQREQSEPLLIFLRALSKEQRDLLCRGEVVNVTSASDTLARLVRHGRFGPQSRDGLSEYLVGDSPLIAAALEVVPTLLVRSSPDSSQAYCEIGNHYTWELGGIKDVQLQADGITCWSSLSAPGAKRERVPKEWRAEWQCLSGPGRDRTQEVLPDLLSALDVPGASVSMSDVSGTTLERLIEDVTKLTRMELSVGTAWTARVLYAKGGSLTARAIVQAVFAAGRLGIMRLGDDDSLTVVYNPHGGKEASFELARQARQAPAPRVTEELRSLLGGALKRPYLDDLPAPLSLFVGGFDGPVSGLPEHEATWVANVIQTCHASMVKAGIPASHQGWLAGTAPIIVRPVIMYQVTVAACVPFRKLDPLTHVRVPGDPPEGYYTALSASRDRPIYSTVTAMLRGY